VDAAIIGPRNPAHLAAALAATSIELSDGDAGKLQNVFA
jgi:aryl-alcohol dehydrogenase-like predicted oxidoreductase